MTDHFMSNVAKNHSEEDSSSSNTMADLNKQMKVGEGIDGRDEDLFSKKKKKKKRGFFGRRRGGKKNKKMRVIFKRLFGVFNKKSSSSNNTLSDFILGTEHSDWSNKSIKSSRRKLRQEEKKVDDNHDDDEKTNMERNEIEKCSDENSNNDVGRVEDTKTLLGGVTLKKEDVEEQVHSEKRNDKDASSANKVVVKEDALPSQMQQQEEEKTENAIIEKKKKKKKKDDDNEGDEILPAKDEDDEEEQPKDVVVVLTESLSPLSQSLIESQRPLSTVVEEEVVEKITITKEKKKKKGCDNGDDGTLPSHFEICHSESSKRSSSSISKDLKLFMDVFRPYSIIEEEAGEVKEEAEEVGAEAVESTQTRRRRRSYDKSVISDFIGNGICTYSDYEEYIQTMLLDTYRRKNHDDESEQHVEKEVLSLFETFRPCYEKAFRSALGIEMDGKYGMSGNNEKKEDIIIRSGYYHMDQSIFASLNANLCVYAGMYDVFRKIKMGQKMKDDEELLFEPEDDKSFAREGDDDDDDYSSQHIGFFDFLDMYEEVSSSNHHHLGFLGLENIDDEDDATEVFKDVDSDEDGLTSFDDWCYYLRKMEIEGETELGEILNKRDNAAEFSDGLLYDQEAEQRQALHENVHRRVDGVNGIELVMPWSDDDSGVYSPQNLQDMSDLNTFIDVFRHDPSSVVPLLEKEVDGGKWNDQFPTLENVSKFISTLLTDKYGEKDGGYLWKKYRPSCVLAYEKVNNIRLQRENELQDDDNSSYYYVLYPNFYNLLNTFLRIYAGMFDAFHHVKKTNKETYEDFDIERWEDYKIDIDFFDFFDGYEDLKKYGFVAFEDVSEDIEEEADAVFRRMDNDEDGLISIKQWFEYLEKIEIDSNTPLGQFLESSIGQES